MLNNNSYIFNLQLDLSDKHPSLVIFYKKILIIKNERDPFNEKIILHYSCNADQLFFNDRSECTG